MIVHHTKRTIVRREMDFNYHGSVILEMPPQSFTSDHQSRTVGSISEESAVKSANYIKAQCCLQAGMEMKPDRVSMDNNCGTLFKLNMRWYRQTIVGQQSLRRTMVESLCDLFATKARAF